ncbi:hypothetical protein KEM52_004117 [Ascosphaera acerosa]|nr:hypothetical protein KEM52_004117 [Ascosphaera acerosa]
MGSSTSETAAQASTTAISYDTLVGPTYVTAQTLVQQVAYALSDKLFTYSPETFDLDTAVKQWFAAGEKNANGYPTSVQAMQTRQGAGTIALGYIFSQDFDLKKRGIPQTIIASSATLRFMRPVLEQLALLYSVASPFVAHVSAVDYHGDSTRGGQLVTDYHGSLRLAEELGLGLVATTSTHEAQHMALFSTLLSKLLPTLHVYDGIWIGREQTRVIDVFSQTRLHAIARAVGGQPDDATQKHLDAEGKLLRLLQAFNNELGTEYGAFEYHGHPQATSVLVTFGTVESSLAGQVSKALETAGYKVGTVNVRVYRPFVEEEFPKVLPESARHIGVLGQVPTELDVTEGGVHSPLYEDVLTTVLFGRIGATPRCVDLKYPTNRIWTPAAIVRAFQSIVEETLPQVTRLVDQSTRQYVFWDLDDSPSASAITAFSAQLAKDPASNVASQTTYDNLVLGGCVRTDVRQSDISIDALYHIDAADVAYVGSLDLLEKVDIAHSLRAGGTLIVNAPGVADADIETKLPTALRQSLFIDKIVLGLLDSSTIDGPEALASELQSLFAQLAAAGSDGNVAVVAEESSKAVRYISIPESWASTEDNQTAESGKANLTDLKPTSFVPFDKDEEEIAPELSDWQSAAKAMLFQEAYSSEHALRPDLPVKTHTVHVRENRRLTPETYDRNIFHIEFDLGDSGLTYDIGEALGIHSENDAEQITEFIEFYGLDPEAVVSVPSRTDEDAMELRTVYQALKYNLDIFGKPPKRFYEALAAFATDEEERAKLEYLNSPEGAAEVKKRNEVDFVTFADILHEFPSAHPAFGDLVRIVSPMKRREYSIASCQKVTPTTVALMIVVVDWVDSKGRKRWGQASHYLSKLAPGTAVTVSVKASVMKLPPSSTQPLIMAGLGTGLAPFRAFVQHRALEKAQGKEIGPILLYMGSRHQREEYCYGEEWEAYQVDGIITLLGRAFSRDQPHKIYIQDRMRETLPEIQKAYSQQNGAFYLCGPTWPVPDVTAVLEEALAAEAKAAGKRVDTRREIEKLKDEERYVLEVY